MIDSLPYKTRAALAFMQAAITRTQIALHAPVVQQVPPACRAVTCGHRVHPSHFASLNLATV